MMNMDALLSLLRYVPSVLGVEVTILAEGGIRIRSAVVKRRWNAVNYVRGEYELDTISKLREDISPGTPLAISINGKGIIHRKVERSSQEDGQVLIKRVFPNANLNDFYFQEIDQDEDCYVSLMKRPDLDSLIREFQVEGLLIHSITLGPFSVLPLIPLLNGKNEMKEIQLDKHRFYFDNGIWKDYAMTLEEKQNYTKMKLLGAEMDERLFVAFANAFCLISEIENPRLPIENLAFEHQEYKQKIQFKRSGVAILALFLCILFVNTFMFLSISDQLKDNNSQEFLTHQSEVKRLKSTLVESNELFRSLHITEENKGTPLAYIADRLAVTLPDALLLTRLTFHPKSKSLGSAANLPVFEFDIIQIDGVTTDIISLNNWVKTIGTLSFCKEVSLDNYSGQEGNGKFLVLIRI